MERLTASIPNGFLLGDLWVREAEIRQLNGFDEQLMSELRDFSLPVKTTKLLERVVTFGKLTEKLDIHETMRHLTVGDRIALLLHVRKATLGDKLESVLSCPACKNRLSLDLSVSSLLQPAIGSPMTEYPLKIDGLSIMVRPLTGIDLETIAEKREIMDPTEQLVRLCIVSSDPPLPKTLSDEFQAAVSTKLEEIDPQADTVLSLVCPTCSQPFQAPLDAESYFFEEIEGRSRQLEREVHWLALNYHWSEKTILSLPVAKRKRYIDLINESLAGEGV